MNELRERQPGGAAGDDWAPDPVPCEKSQRPDHGIIASDGFLRGVQYLILDRDPLYTAAFRHLLRDTRPHGGRLCGAGRFLLHQMPRLTSAKLQPSKDPSCRCYRKRAYTANLTAPMDR